MTLHFLTHHLKWEEVTTIVDTNLVDLTEYVVRSLTDNYSYNIYIVANDGDTVFSATSNQLLLVPNLPKKPDYNYIEYASINHDNGFVEINCLVDNSAIIDYYDKFWQAIPGTRGAIGKKTVNASGKFSEFFVEDNEDTVQSDDEPEWGDDEESKLNQLELQVKK